MRILDPDRLQSRRAEFERRGGEHPSLGRLAATIEPELAAGPFSVCDKPADIVAPSGDPHDYVSLGPYWWPDPAKADGLPWVRHDGQHNPLAQQQSDRPRLAAMLNAVRRLALGWFYLRDPRCAERAVMLLGTWFINPQTRMNPHMRFAQAIPGRCEGRGIGLIDTAGMPMLLDAVEMLADAPACSDNLRAELARWFDALLDWMLVSVHGHEEREHPNNHGTYYDVQVARYALFVGREVVAREVIQQVPERRIAAHIEPDGRQPRELARTRALGYSMMNLRGLCVLARLGRGLGVDLWSYSGPGGRSIRRAIAFLEPYMTGEQAWPWPQIGEVSWEPAAALLRLAASECDEPHYAALAQRLALEDPGRTECELMFPLDGMR